MSGTGLGGQKVVLDGGSVVLPIFTRSPVNLKTLRLEVTRGGPDSLITKDRMRVDIGAEFYVRKRRTYPRSRLRHRRWATAPTTRLNCAS